MAFSVGKEELSEPVPLLKKLSAEFLGTMLLVIFGCGAAAGQGNENSKTMVIMKQSYLICLSLFIPDSTLDRLIYHQDVRTLKQYSSRRWPLVSELQSWLSRASRDTSAEVN